MVTPPTKRTRPGTPAGLPAADVSWGPVAEAGLTPAPPGVSSCGAPEPHLALPSVPSAPGQAGGRPAPPPRQVQVQVTVQVQVSVEKARRRCRDRRARSRLLVHLRGQLAPICFCNCCPDGPRVLPKEAPIWHVSAADLSFLVAPCLPKRPGVATGRWSGSARQPRLPWLLFPETP